MTKIDDATRRLLAEFAALDARVEAAEAARLEAAGWLESRPNHACSWHHDGDDGDDSLWGYFEARRERNGALYLHMDSIREPSGLEKMSLPRAMEDYQRFQYVRANDDLVPRISEIWQECYAAYFGRLRARDAVIAAIGDPLAIVRALAEAYRLRDDGGSP